MGRKLRLTTVGVTLATLCLQIRASLAIDFVVTGAQVTELRMVDPGFKTFSAAASGLPLSRALDPNESFDFDAFVLFTDESKVNTEEPPGGDATPYPITATVTFSKPVATTLTFSGTTVGEEDFSVVPASAQVSQAALILWGTQNPDLASLALGRGYVQWDGPRTIDLGGGLQAVVTLQPASYNDALQLRGPGVGQAGTVEAVVELVTDAGPRKAPFEVRDIILTGDTVEVTWTSKLDHLYQVQTSMGTGEINFTDASAIIVGKEGITSTAIARPAATDELFLRVIVLGPN